MNLGDLRRRSRQESDEDFTAFVAASMRDLRRTAYLLCGDWDRADDAVQTALVGVYPRWRRLETTNSAWSYVRRAVVNAVIDDARRRRARPEHLPGELPDTALDDPTDRTGDRMLVRLALDSLPTRQRAVVVLRYVDDLDEATTAQILRWPVGTVSSNATRAMAALRTFLLERGVHRGAPDNTALKGQS